MTESRARQGKKKDKGQQHTERHRENTATKVSSQRWLAQCKSRQTSSNRPVLVRKEMLCLQFNNVKQPSASVLVCSSGYNRALWVPRSTASFIFSYRQCCVTHGWSTSVAWIISQCQYKWWMDALESIWFLMIKRLTDWLKTQSAFNVSGWLQMWCCLVVINVVPRHVSYIWTCFKLILS